MQFDKVSSDFLDRFHQLIDQSGNREIIVTSHLSPDDDSIASVLCVYHYLIDHYPGWSVRMVYSGARARNYGSFKYYNRIEFVEDLAAHLVGTVPLVLVDGSKYDRFSLFPDKLGDYAGPKICIDHHHPPWDKFDLSLIVVDVPATAELLFRMFYQNPEITPITPELAETILMGILGDTGGFTFLRPDQSETLLIAQRLIRAGNITIQDLQARYQTITPRIFEIIQELVKNTQYFSLSNWPGLHASLINRNYVSENEYTGPEISDAKSIYQFNYVRKIQGYPWGLVLTPRFDGSCRISFRAMPGTVNVRRVVERMGIGGGHDLASGGTFYPSSPDQSLAVAECLQEVLEWLDANDPDKPQFN